MEPSPPWEANSRGDTQECPDMLWNPKAHYRVHKSLTNSINPEPHHSIPYRHILSKMHSNIVLHL
jgi:hypothetical protein